MSQFADSSGSDENCTLTPVFQGIFDFTPFVAAGTAMTEPLRKPAFFSNAFIELGALAWPNGFELSAESLHRRLGEAGALQRGTAAA